MLPFGNETVTLVQRLESVTNGKTHVSYSKTTLTGCSWRRKRILRKSDNSRDHSDNAFLGGEEVTCRVPAGQVLPRTGDLMILGEVAATVTSGADYQGLIDRFKDTGGAFIVTSVADNARSGMPMPHYAARGG